MGFLLLAVVLSGDQNPEWETRGAESTGGSAFALRSLLLFYKTQIKAQTVKPHS